MPGLEPPHSRKDRRAAEAAARRAGSGRVAAEPPPAVAQLLQAAVAHHQAGRLAEADALYAQALRADPGNPDALHLSGLIAHQQGDHARAVTLISRALERGDTPGYRHNLALALDAAGRPAEARAAYQRALALEERATAHNNLAGLLAGEGARDAAVTHYRRALALDPSLAEAHYNLGALLRDGDRAAEAEPHLRRAVALAPRHAQAWRTLGLVQEDLGRPADAIACYDRALGLAPGDAEVLNNLGNAQKQLGRFDAAIASYTAALQARPDDASATVNRALARLTIGDFAQGWRDYRRRDPLGPADKTVLTRDALPDLAGKRVLVFNDQGPGDELFFLRFMPELKRRGARLAYRASDMMAPLVRRLACLDAVAGREEPADLRLSVSDLPFLLGHADAAAIPPSVRIPPLPERSAALAARLAALGPGPFIGVTWRAGIQKRNSLSKVVPLEGIAAALAGARGAIIVVQRNPLAGELDRLAALTGRPAHDFTALNQDLDGMLALLALLDDYVAVSNTNLHLRAAVGRTCRVLVPVPPDYRWMAAGEQSPWFPGTAVYREDISGGWDAALARLAADLRSAYPPA